MSKKDDFILDAVSGIDDDIVEKHLQKRLALWRKKGKKKIPWMRIVAAAACLCVVAGGLFLLLDVLFGKQVPIYRGMTVSNEMPTLNSDALAGQVLVYDFDQDHFALPQKAGGSVQTAALSGSVPLNGSETDTVPTRAGTYTITIDTLALKNAGCIPSSFGISYFNVGFSYN